MPDFTHAPALTRVPALTHVPVVVHPPALVQRGVLCGHLLRMGTCIDDRGLNQECIYIQLSPIDFHPFEHSSISS